MSFIVFIDFFNEMGLNINESQWFVAVRLLHTFVWLLIKGIWITLRVSNNLYILIDYDEGDCLSEP